jgi:gamma-glutamyltranspeptidase/glutathione hydrolase
MSRVNLSSLPNRLANTTSVCLRAGCMAALLLVFSSGTFAAEAPIIDPLSTAHPVFSRSGMVVSQELLASQVGAQILEKGGNAVDAAVATGFALAVTLPRAGNIGGGGFMLIYLAEQGKTIALDYREMAPSGADRDMFLNHDASVNSQLARHSIKSSGVPGTVAGLVYAQHNYGALSLKEVMQPAIDLARNGFAVNVDLADTLKTRQTRLMKDPATKGYFFKPDGSLYQYGERLVQRDLAAALKRIASKGRAGFYQGKTAQLIVEQMQLDGGLINAEDLKNYRVIVRQPVCGSYLTNRVCVMPPPSSGGVHLIQMLNILEGWDLEALGHNSAAYLHRLVEVMRRAYADRSAYLGDPDFYPVPVAELTDKAYADRLRSEIDLTRASVSSEVGPGLAHYNENDSALLAISDRAKLIKESPETTHFSVWDSAGNVVSNTYTLNFSYGSGIAVAGAGFLLNNEMDDFSSSPGVPNAFGLLGGEANAIEPGKRPLSAMTPTIVFNADQKPVLATGSPGGSTIITVVLQMLLNMLTFDMNVADATAMARIHHQWLPDRIDYEPGISVDTLRLLRDMGHQISAKPRILGATQSIYSDTNNNRQGASDSRRQGAGAVAEPR